MRVYTYRRERLPPVGVGRNIDAEVPRADLSGRVV